MAILSLFSCKENESQRENCSDLTQDGITACTKTNALKNNKICIWEFDECRDKELPPLLKDFMSKDLRFEVPIPVAGFNLATDQGLGVDHSEAPEWNKICSLAIVGGSLYSVVAAISLDFAKDTRDLAINIDCTKGGGGIRTYNFSYEAKALPDNSLLLRLNTQENVAGTFEVGRNGNLLEFFSKAHVLYDPAKSQIILISQLGNLGYRIGDPLYNLKEKNAFEKAIQYARTPTGPGSDGGGGYEIAKENGKSIGAVTLIFSKI